MSVHQVENVYAVLASKRKRHGSPAPRLTDDQVMEARRLHELEGRLAHKILQHFQIPVTQTTRCWMGAILRYEKRSSRLRPLDPKLGR